MKPCRNPNMPPRRQTAAGQSGGQSAPPPVGPTPVHRYTHPIRTARPAQRSSTEELLSYILETLSRQSDQLDELLRRTDGDDGSAV